MPAGEKFLHPVGVRPRKEGEMRNRSADGFTLLELLVVVGVIGILAGLLLPGLARATLKARQIACVSNQRQLGLAATLYMSDHNGQMFHHHEGWVLDDGTQLDALPASLGAVTGGGQGNSQAEKPWVIILQPYLKSRKVGFCPADPTRKSDKLSLTLAEYNGAIQSADQDPPAGSELAIAEANHLTVESYLLNSIFTHRSARYALEGVLPGFATEAAISALPDPDLIMFSERNSEAMNAADNDQFGNVAQDDYDTWVGEAALVRWGAGKYGNEGWIRHNRHDRRSNYIFIDGRVETLPWKKARSKQFPDHKVRKPLANIP